MTSYGGDVTAPISPTEGASKRIAGNGRSRSDAGSDVPDCEVTLHGTAGGAVVGTASGWATRSGVNGRRDDAESVPASSGDPYRDELDGGGATTAGQLGSSDRPLCEVYDCAVLDLDGVVYVGDTAVPLVPDRLRKARERGMALAFVTNNASRPPETVSAHLRSLGVEAADADVVTSAQAAAREVAARVPPGSPVLVVGGKGLELALRERDLVPVSSCDDEPVAVVQGYGPQVGWRELAEATYAVRSGALWVASNLDLTVPTARGIAPGNGTLVAAVATALGRSPDVVAGKPYRPLFDETARRVGSTRPLVVGDRLDTDIAGAVRWGADSLLVMTGVTDLAGLAGARPQERPTYVGWTLGSLLRPHAVPVPAAAGGWRLGEWVMTAADGRVSVSGRGDDRDVGLRVFAATVWDWHDRNDGDAPLDLRALEEGWPTD